MVTKCRYCVGCRNEEVAGIRVVKVLATGIAAATANFFWFSGYVPVSTGPVITLNASTIIPLLAFGIILALPLDRLLRSATLRTLKIHRSFYLKVWFHVQ